MFFSFLLNLAVLIISFFSKKIKKKFIVINKQNLVRILKYDIMMTRKFNYKIKNGGKKLK